MLSHIDADLEAFRVAEDHTRGTRGPELIAAVERSSASHHFEHGDRFVLDAPTEAPALWGSREQVAWARGESLLIVGPTGVGKTTLAGLLVAGQLGLRSEVLGMPVVASEGALLYMAMDRPAQARRALRRQFNDSDRETLRGRLKVWSGPPPYDLAQRPETLLELARDADAHTVVLDSLKDAALKLSDDAVGAAYNRARQGLLADGRELIELHHTRKPTAGGGTTDKLADSYGSVWITAGAGSVIGIWGDAGDPIVELRHLKMPAGEVGPLRVSVDHALGELTVLGGELTALDLLRGGGSIQARDLAAAATGTDSPSRGAVEKARRQLEKLADDGLVERLAGIAPKRGGVAPVAYGISAHSRDHSRGHLEGLAS
jgi:replicative DNA helicase